MDIFEHIEESDSWQKGSVKRLKMNKRTKRLITLGTLAAILLGNIIWKISERRVIRVSEGEIRPCQYF